MILSSMNFVNNYKFSDFIISKITEEQQQLESLHQQKEDLHSDSTEVSSSATCQSCCSTEDVSNYDNCVTIATPDGYFLTVDHGSLQVSLKQETDVRPRCVFRRTELEAVSEKQKLVVFQSLLEPSYYLATTQERHMELQSYCADTLRPDVRDERVFTVHEVSDSTVFIQPLAHKGHYLHHLDSTMSVRNLDINFRPPEEFYMTINEVSEMKIRAILPKPYAESVPVQEPDGASEKIPEEPAKFNRKGSKKVKDHQQSPLTPKPSILSCFGLGMKKRDKNKR